MRWMLLAVMLVVQASTARALTITYTSINESISAFQVCAIAGNHGSGPCDAASASDSRPTFIEQRDASAVDADNDTGALALATGSAGQATLLTSGGVNTNGSAVTGAQVFLTDIARAEAFSELKTAFFLDQDARFTIHGEVNCAGDCTAFVSLLGPEDEVIFDLTTTDGARDGEATVTLLRNQSYFVWARATSLAAVTGTGFDTGRGDFALAMVVTGGEVPGIPEPSIGVLLVSGLTGVLALRRSRGRSPPKSQARA